ncbi:MAG: glycosyltransferase family 2 protein [Isosphaeraceae bacterium]|nr:glycosyltransferase family 2 protein [Isosphaeraceae bacterium]
MRETASPAVVARHVRWIERSEAHPTLQPTISALVIARDEAGNLPDCLAALAWADERIVVVDAASRDGTEVIARRLADQVLIRSFDDFASQRNAALDLASGDWIFAVDADEHCSAELADEIRRTIADPAHVGYRVPIRSVILGRPFAYSGTQHDQPIRLFRRDAGHWVGVVHETIELRGSIGRLLQPLRHRTIPDMQTFLRKLDAYTTLEARKLLAEGRRFHLSDLMVRPLWTFAKLYFAKQGFRDGLEGLVFCALSGVSVAVRHWKHRELLRAGGPS